MFPTDQQVVIAGSDFPSHLGSSLFEIPNSKARRLVAHGSLQLEGWAQGSTEDQLIQWYPLKEWRSPAHGEH